MKSRRILAIGIVGSSLAAMAAVDRFVDRPVTKSAITANAEGLGDTAASGTDSGSSLWFCPAGESADGVDTIITIVNPTAQAGSGSVTFHGNAGQTASVEVQIGAYARIDVPASDTLAAVGVGAIVELNVGGLAVEQKVVSGDQTYGAPCATSTSSTWYFADGDTTLGASTVLSVLNPFGEDAVLDISFATDRGAARPNDLQGFLVPASSMRRIDIGTYVRRRAEVSTVVKARVGRVAIDQTTSPDGARYSMVSGSPVLGSSWYFPAGRTNGVLRERYVLFNPTTTDVSAQIDVVVEGGEVEPFEIDVPARSRVDLVPNEESRIARDTDYSVVVATDSPSLVVQRTLRASGIYRAGFATTLGSRRSATDWVVPDVVASATRDDTIALLNPTDTPTAVSLFLNSGAPGAGDANDAGTAGVVDGQAPQAIAGAQNLLLKAASRTTVRLSDFAPIAKGSLLVQSSAAEIVVERTATAVKRRGKRTERPAYVLADAISLATTTDTLPDLSTDGGSDSASANSGDPALPVDDTYGSDPVEETVVGEIPAAEIPSDGSETTLAARALSGASQTLRFGEFFVVLQAPSTTRPVNLSTTSSTSSTVSVNTATRSTTTRSPSTVPAASAVPVPSTTTTVKPNPAESNPAAPDVGEANPAESNLAESNPAKPQMGLGPVAKAGSFTFSALAIPRRSGR
jgi:hypothetical protein